MIREHPAFDLGRNKIFNITGMVRDDQGSIALPASSLALPGTIRVTSGKHRCSADTNQGWSGAWYSRQSYGRVPVNAGRAPVKAGRAPVNADRALEDDDGATVDPFRVPAKPGSFQKNHNLRWFHLFLLKPFPSPFYPVLHKDFQKIIMNYCSGSIDRILKEAVHSFGCLVSIWPGQIYK
jgi:hypothetical protein